MIANVLSPMRLLAANWITAANFTADYWISLQPVAMHLEHRKQ